MGNDEFPDDERSKRDAAERKLRGDPDTDLHLDGEEDTLYSDGLVIKGDSETLSGTHGVSPGSIKP